MALCAMRAIVREYQGQNVKVPTGAYLCSQCRCWHLTSKSGDSDATVGQQTSYALTRRIDAPDSAGDRLLEEVGRGPQVIRNRTAPARLVDALA